MQKIPDDLVEFIDKPREVIVEKMNQSEQTLKAKWETGIKVIDFYTENEDYLYNLAWYNLHESYFAFCTNTLGFIQNKRILDIGCGIGTISFILAGQRNEVTGYDINPLLIDFCNFKKKKYSLEGSFTTEKPDYSQFDVILAIDVLEHIEDLHGFLKELGSGMKKGAVLYHDDCWGCQNVNPMHFDHSKEIDLWLWEAGIIPLSNLWAAKF